MYKAPFCETYQISASFSKLSHMQPTMANTTLIVNNEAPYVNNPRTNCAKKKQKSQLR